MTHSVCLFIYVGTCSFPDGNFTICLSTTTVTTCSASGAFLAAIVSCDAFKGMKKHIVLALANWKHSTVCNSKEK